MKKRDYHAIDLEALARWGKSRTPTQKEGRVGRIGVDDAGRFHEIKPVKTKLVESFRQWRKQNGLTLVDVKRDTGIRVAELSDIEGGYVPPTAKWLKMVIVQDDKVVGIDPPGPEAGL